MCDHDRVERHMEIGPGRFVFEVRCLECGAEPSKEMMDILTMEAIVEVAAMKLARPEPTLNVNLN